MREFQPPITPKEAPTTAEPQMQELELGTSEESTEGNIEILEGV